MCESFIINGVTFSWWLLRIPVQPHLICVFNLWGELCVPNKMGGLEGAMSWLLALTQKTCLMLTSKAPPTTLLNPEPQGSSCLHFSSSEVAKAPQSEVLIP